MLESTKSFFLFKKPQLIDMQTEKSLENQKYPHNTTCKVTFHVENGDAIL